MSDLPSGSDPSAATLRRRLGVTGTGASRDLAGLAALAAGEEVEAVVVAIWGRRGWVGAATRTGLLLVRRPRLFGRARDQRFTWDTLRAARSGPQRLDLTFGDTQVDLMAIGPHAEFVRLAEAARRRLGDEDKPSVEEIRELARRKLGRMATLGFEASIDGLPDRLEPGERVERLAGATLDFHGLLVLTDRRLILLDVTLRRAAERIWDLDRARIRKATAVGDGLRLQLDGGQVTLTGFVPGERRDEFAAVLGASRS